MSFPVIRVNVTGEEVLDERNRYSQKTNPECEVSDAETMTEMEPLPESNDRVYRISTTVVAKFDYDYDRLLAEYLAIIHNDEDFYAVIVMECISNARRLEDCWESLSLWRKFIVLLTLRSYVQQLRKIDLHERTRPGPVGPKPLECQGLSFGLEFTSRFKTCKALERHFDKAHRMAEKCGPCKTIKPLPRSATRNLVFTHNDLSLRNILLDEDDQVWLIDWGFSGFFPPFSEYVSIRAAEVTHGFPKSLSPLVQDITPPDDSQGRVSNGGLVMIYKHRDYRRFRAYAEDSRLLLLRQRCFYTT